MKQSFLSLVIIAGMAMMISSCSKPSVDTNPKPGGGANPVINKVSSDTPWFGGVAHVTIDATGAAKLYVGSELITGNTYNVANVTNPVSLHIKVVSSEGKSAETDFTVTAWSQTMTYWCNYGPVHGNLFRICREDSINFPSAWHDKPELIDNNYITSYPDGSYEINGLRSNPGIWSFRNNETVYFNGVQSWTIYDPNAPAGHQPYVNATGWRAYKVEIDQVNPSLRWRTEIGYIH
jgi:hypothetical protein